MLKILSVNPTGFGPYGVHADVVMDGRGVVWLNGENLDKGGSNGSGKSCFFNALAFCLWGKVETVVGGTFTGSDDIINETLGIGACPRVTFEASDAVTWRVTCSRKWKAAKSLQSPYVQDSELWPYKGSDVFLERWDGAKWVDERLSTAIKTRDKVREVVGLSYERYLATTYLAQGKGLDFLRGTHAQRMAIFTDIMDLSVWDAATLKCKGQREASGILERVAEDRLLLVNGQLRSLRILEDSYEAESVAELERKAAVIIDLEAQKKDLSDRALRIAEHLGSVRIGANPYVAALAEFDVAARGATQKLQMELQQHQAAYSRELLRSRDAVTAINARTSPEVQQVQARLSVAKVAFDRAQRTLADFQTGRLTRCPTCGQDLPDRVDGSHIRAELDSAAVEVSALESLLAEAIEKHKVSIKFMLAGENGQAAELIRGNCEAAEKALKRLASEQALDRGAISQKVADYAASEAEKNAAIATLNSEQSQVKAEIAGVEAQMTKVRADAHNLESILAMSRAERQRKIELLANCEQLEKELALAKLETAEWAWLLKNLGDKGLKAFKLEVACQRLSDILADSLADLDGGFRMWVVPYRRRPGSEDKPEDLLTSEDVVNEITVFVQEGGKQAVPIYMYSGGEASVVAFALLVALWRLADEQGSGTNLLLLDEVVGFLDSQRSQVVIRFIEGLKTTGKTVIVVSHSQVVDSVNFDEVLTCTKENGVSTLRGA